MMIDDSAGHRDCITAPHSNFNEPTVNFFYLFFVWQRRRRYKNRKISRVVKKVAV